MAAAMLAAALLAPAAAPATKEPSVFRRHLGADRRSSRPADAPGRPGARAGACPNPDGGACLGRLRAGRHETSVFEPRIRYRVPSGWANYEDLPGNFLLVAPGDTLAGVNAGTSDFIGIFSGLAAVTARCAEQPDPDVATTPAAIARVWRDKPYLRTTRPRQVSVGGLTGLVIDLRLPKGFKRPCPFPDFTDPLAVVAAGVPPSSFLHGVIPGLVMRFYLLDHGDRTLAIEVDALQHGKNLPRYARIVGRISFDV